MNRLAPYPTDTLIGRHAPIGTFMVMDCFCKTDIPEASASSPLEIPGSMLRIAPG